MRLGIKVEELGRALDADQMFHGDVVPVTPLIEKLRIHVQNYVDLYTIDFSRQGLWVCTKGQDLEDSS